MSVAIYVLSRFLALVLLPFFCIICLPNAAAQVVIATVTTGGGSGAVAVNKVTNKIYVPNSLNGSGSVTIIDGATSSTTTVLAGLHPAGVAVDEATNKMYVANTGDCGPFGNCSSHGSVTVIDGATNSTTTVADPNANAPAYVAVNSVTNKIYVANVFSGNVTVIDGATNSTTTVTDPNAAGLVPAAVAVNAVTNKIYVANNSRAGPNPGSVTVIDGATNSTTTITDPNAVTSVAVAVNPVTNKIYVANEGDYPGPNHGNVTVIDGATNSTTTIAIDPNALAPQSVAVDQTSNKIYVAAANDSALTGIGGVTVIDGTTNSISTVKDPNAMFPQAVIVDSVTNTIYVANQGCFLDDACINRGSVTVINGATSSVTTIIDPNVSNPTGLALDPTTDKIYVAGLNVIVIDGGATPTTHILSLLLPGIGSGTVTSNPPGINCMTSCTASFVAGTAVSLTASPASGSRFSGWSTNCTGTAACDLTMTSDDFVTATFGPRSDFSLQPASAILTARRGGEVTDVVTVTPVGGASFENAIQLSCAVATEFLSQITTMPTCALSPSSVTPGANSATSTLTIIAPAASAMLQPTIRGQLKFLFATCLPFPGIVLFGIGLISRKQRHRSCNLWLLTGSLLALFAVVAGCGGSSNGLQPPPQNYTVTVTGTSGAIQHTTQVIVTVQ